MVRLAPGAKVVDASAEALDPQIVRFRGRSPLVLVPIANPASAATLVTMADALAPRSVARVLLLSVVRPPTEWNDDLPAQIVDAQSILGRALSTAIKADLNTEALITMGENPWREIERVANRNRCESLVLGFGHLEESLTTGSLETLVGNVTGDVVIVRAPTAWNIDQVQKILVPAGGKRDQSRVRARLIGNICRARPREVTYLKVLPATADPTTVDRARRELRRLADDEAPGVSSALVTRRDDIITEIVERAAASGPGG